MINKIKPHTVFLVEDDIPTRRRLAKIIDNHSQLELMAHVGSCTEARAQFSLAFPDVFLTDLGLPDGNGIELISEVHHQSKNTDIMVVTVFADEKNVLSAIESGATGYLLKDDTDEKIGEAIIQLIEGYSPLSPIIARHVLKRFTAPIETLEKPPFLESQDTDQPHLTSREKMVLEYIAKGFSYKETAEILGNSVHTITSHIKKIYKKLSVKSKNEAVFEAIQLGLINVGR
jgi:DNA-binding NarL/FixJ family response regulator